MSAIIPSVHCPSTTSPFKHHHSQQTVRTPCHHLCGIAYVAATCTLTRAISRPRQRKISKQSMRLLILRAQRFEVCAGRIEHAASWLAITRTGAAILSGKFTGTNTGSSTASTNTNCVIAKARTSSPATSPCCQLPSGESGSEPRLIQQA